MSTQFQDTNAFEPALTLEKSIESLNEPQRTAVLAPENHMLISAAAGTGKTRVLTLRYAYLAYHYNIPLDKIAAVTFTNKAAFEMKRRLQSMFPVRNLWIGTFHSLGLRIIRQHAEKAGRTSSFTVLDTSDQQNLIQKIMKNLDPKKTTPPRAVLHAISQWKQETLLPDDVLRAKVPFYVSVYREYQNQLERLNSLDFDDLLLYSYRLFSQYPEILDQYAFQHILVDEYQDVNQMQYLWLKKLSEKGGYLFCVGDDDQSIYGWRGASIDKILRFPKDFPNAGIICLEDNYRSTPHILSAASHLIAHNEARYGKVLRTSHANGEKIKVQGLWDSTEEASFIAQDILLRHQKGESLGSMAILVRTGAQTREFEERFVLQNIPYYLVGNTRFYERMEIRDFLGYLRVIHSPLDNLAFERILNVPKRGIGSVTLQQLHTISQENLCSLEEASRRFCAMEEENRPALSLFLKNIDEWRAFSGNLAELAEKILTESGYTMMWKAQGIQGEARLENLKEITKAMEPFGTLGEFLEHVSLLAEVSSKEGQEGVALMTLHAAKGLEFDTVFLPGWEENVFPHVRSIEESGKKGIEEERRLAYVGITRARLNSTITFCWNRRTHQGFLPSTPSRFINELPQDDITLSLKLSYTAKDAPLEQQQRVIHSVFGHGTVQSQCGNTVSVLFDSYGLKKVISRFLNFIS